MAFSGSQTTAMSAMALPGPVRTFSAKDPATISDVSAYTYAPDTGRQSKTRLRAQMNPDTRRQQAGRKNNVK